MSTFTIYEDGTNFINAFEATDTSSDVNQVSEEVKAHTKAVLQEHEGKRINKISFTSKLFGFDNHDASKYTYRFYAVGVTYEDGTAKSYRVKGEYEN
ncbi:MULTISPECIES: hypothetical protein [Bacillus]|jgi:hypothetical protein|uniref:Uncharacterized protein n=2 Tax=Bacillus cereus group TaxID=86661 RepID=Q73F17_BACC1|nr:MULTISPECIES: hypothetical protein [Bacillus]AAS39126.1 hypothetical protein BCE_0190 [Bacillus cereus ATCC 10987]KMQ35785.1 hypothetical protein TU53_06365 [Bacillus cereus]KXY75668.1 hypothetical protein AT272_09415 [Bacillus cereus]MCU5157181.1 hypothetical protein [Bacillus pacificus]MCU9944563.1 hypothetical protein [Bacillus pacificus]